MGKKSFAAATLAGRVELMAPYPCKFCRGWHNGHPPIDRYRDCEPVCPCRHKAVTHDPFPGLGCIECDCVAHREGVYRRAIGIAERERRMELRRRRQLAAVVGTVIAALPAAVAREIKLKLQERFRPAAM